mmetsp:Transcript_13558/g.20353  ORF Transcript_13558/g.20353 Transcript_13558/m.20353 type:complete len:116 (-) Transcript_13558:312-659(-)
MAQETNQSSSTTYNNSCIGMAIIALTMHKLPPNSRLYDIVDIFEPYGALTHASIESHIVDNHVVLTGDGEIQIQVPIEKYSHVMEKIRSICMTHTAFEVVINDSLSTKDLTVIKE